MSNGATPGKRSQRVIELLGTVIGSSSTCAQTVQQLGIPNHVLQAANHHGIWDVTALLPYISNS
jgi:hypothetical protein